MSNPPRRWSIAGLQDVARTHAIVSAEVDPSCDPGEPIAASVALQA